MKHRWNEWNQEWEEDRSGREYRKKLQKTVNKGLHMLNKAIEEDELWKGRFVYRQIDAFYEKFCDGSGGMLSPIINFIDKKTGIIISERPYDIWNSSLDSYFFSKLCWRMNDFIIHDCKAWDENPKEDKTDYTKVKLPENWHERKWW